MRQHLQLKHNIKISKNITPDTQAPAALPQKSDEEKIRDLKSQLHALCDEKKALLGTIERQKTLLKSRQESLELCSSTVTLKSLRGHLTDFQNSVLDQFEFQCKFGPRSSQR